MQITCSKQWSKILVLLSFKKFIYLKNNLGRRFPLNLKNQHKTACAKGIKPHHGFSKLQLQAFDIKQSTAFQEPQEGGFEYHTQ